MTTHDNTWRKPRHLPCYATEKGSSKENSVTGRARRGRAPRPTGHCQRPTPPTPAELKVAGNAVYQEGDYATSITCYQSALDEMGVDKLVAPFLRYDFAGMPEDTLESMLVGTPYTHRDAVLAMMKRMRDVTERIPEENFLLSLVCQSNLAASFIAVHQYEEAMQACRLFGAFSTPCEDFRINESLPYGADNYPCRASVWAWKGLGPQCVMGRYVPPQCLGEKAKYCQEIYAAHPEWDLGFFEGLGTPYRSHRPGDFCSCNR